MLKEELLEVKGLFSETTLLLDLWYYWAENDFWDWAKAILIPKKKPWRSKKNPYTELTKEEKESNRIISSFRIKVENAIGWAKRFWAVTQIFRNKSEKLNDDVIEVACALWNFHLLF